MADRQQSPKRRIRALDILKGAIMVIMVLDHVRDFFHFDVHYFGPADPIRSSLPLFFTRWITHFCAPTFVLLSGASIAFVASRKSVADTRFFLLTRGFWLMFCDAIIVSFLWFFNPGFDLFLLGVIWAIGLSMVCSAFTFRMNTRSLLGLALAIGIGHHTLDALNIDTPGLAYAILHQQTRISFSSFTIATPYPLLPWLGVMWGGIALGRSYLEMEAKNRLKWMRIVGWTVTLAFVLIRGFDGYGNTNHWSAQATWTGTILDVLNPHKYPPSLAYLTMTLGPALLALTLLERTDNRVSRWLEVYGKVPFFFYLLHLLVIHLLAIPAAAAQGFGWDAMVLDVFVSLDDNLKGYGFSLVTTYLIWIVLVLALHPPCKWWMNYKRAHPDMWWLSYL